MRIGILAQFPSSVNGAVIDKILVAPMTIGETDVDN
jgi:hypothetical protein